MGRANVPARICSAGFSGKNAGLQVPLYRGSLKPAQVAGWLGGAPDTVVLLTGVNDVVQHVGAATYADNLATLVDHFGDGPRIFVVDVPRIDTDPPSDGARWWKRNIQRVWNDGGTRDAAIPAYRAAARATVKNATFVDFDRFATGPAAEPARYAADRIHLTDAELGRLGAYVADAVVPARPR